MVVKSSAKSTAKKAPAKKVPAKKAAVKQNPEELAEDATAAWGSGFTTDTASGQPDKPDPEQPWPDDKPAPKKGSTAGRKTAPEDSEAPVNLTNMRVDLVKGVESIERILEEIAALKDDAKEFFSELKQRGYSTAIVRKVIARRVMDPDKRKEQDALLDLYEEALK